MPGPSAGPRLHYPRPSKTELFWPADFNLGISNAVTTGSRHIKRRSVLRILELRVTQTPQNQINTETSQHVWPRSWFQLPAKAGFLAAAGYLAVRQLNRLHARGASLPLRASFHRPPLRPILLTQPRSSIPTLPPSLPTPSSSVSRDIVSPMLPPQTDAPQPLRVPRRRLSTSSRPRKPRLSPESPSLTRTEPSTASAR